MRVWDLVCTELGGGLGSIFMTILNREHPKNGGMLGVLEEGQEIKDEVWIKVQV